jgi:chemotaxis protein CheX
MKAEHINPFLSAAVNVFSTMVNCSLTRGQPFLKGGSQPEYEVSGIVGLSGRAKGTIVLSLCREAALAVASAMLGEPVPEIGADVCDAVGELTNMIAGSAKAQLENLALTVSLPSVITGRGHSVDFPRHVTPICIPFESPWGAITVEVGLADEAAH